MAMLSAAAAAASAPPRITNPRTAIPLYRGTLVPQEDWEKVFPGITTTQGFVVGRICTVENPVADLRWRAQCISMGCKAGQTTVPFYRLLHATPTNNIASILNDGLDVKRASAGFFGKGIYFANDISKANMHSHCVGNPNITRTMFVCNVALGRIKHYEMGYFDRSKTAPPEEYDSVSGFVRKELEYVVYNNDQVNITHVITYKFPDTAMETIPQPVVSNYNIALIPSGLSEFINKLVKNCSSPEQTIDVKKTIGMLLKKMLTTVEFVQRIEQLFGLKSPPDLVERLNSELSKCNISNLPSNLPPIPMPINESLHPFGAICVATATRAPIPAAASAPIPAAASAPAQRPRVLVDPMFAMPPPLIQCAKQQHPVPTPRTPVKVVVPKAVRLAAQSSPSRKMSRMEEDDDVVIITDIRPAKKAAHKRALMDDKAVIIDLRSTKRIAVETTTELEQTGVEALLMLNFTTT